MIDAEDRAEAERLLCGLVGGMAHRIEAHLRERAATLDLTAPQATALRELSGPMTMRELAERMSCDPSNATYVVDRLEKLGLVERRPVPGDRRAKRIVLTDDGSGLRGRLLLLLRDDSPLAALSPAEQKTLHDLLNRARAVAAKPATRTGPSVSV